ncbi:transketolase [Aerococcus urinaeequi]|uniref:Transketolase n=1 Tax=Aerococcus urinaeequi TaxID=51665 RepID=A0AA47G9M7_9LACT|nr:transketolase [Aerococcus urinaeequi]WAT24886.1 transketolase [Aerococcus urinaeequi]
MFNKSDQLAVDTLRSLSISQINRANSGHPGLPLGAAPMVYALWAGHLNIDGSHPDWSNQDRFVLSAGHGSALLYSLLHVSGFDISIEDLKKFRQLNSRTPGHPESHITAGVHATTGPLGQGISEAVGLATAEAHAAALYNREEFDIVNHYTYVLCGDGDLMEGISYEACSFAGHQKLEKLIMLYDSNDISLDGAVSDSFSEDIKLRFESQGWHYQLVQDGTNLEEIYNAIESAKNEDEKPSIIEIKTTIGFGSPLAGSHKVHGNPLSKEQWQDTKKELGYHYEDFDVPKEAEERFKSNIRERGSREYENWKLQFDLYSKKYPALANQYIQSIKGELPDNYDKNLTFITDSNYAEASRDSINKAIQNVANTIPWLWGGSADLFSSNKTYIEGAGDFKPTNRSGKNIWYGVREFAMAGISNGIILYGGSKTFLSTFFIFSDYAKNAIRIAALSKLPNIFILTHDSIALGPDGPTHQPIEQFAQFRAMPNLNVIRPADVNETNVAFKIALESKETPTMIALSRQPLPIIKSTKEEVENGVRNGAYIVSESKKIIPDGILIATGSELTLALKVKEKLCEQDIDVRVVSMPSTYLFDQQSHEYKEAVLPKDVSNKMSIEMGSTMPWYKYVGKKGYTYGIDTFGTSGPADEVIEKYGFTVEKVVSKYLEVFYK